MSFKELFNKFDVDSNGTIEFHEFLEQIKIVFNIDKSDNRFNNTFLLYNILRIFSTKS